MLIKEKHRMQYRYRQNKIDFIYSHIEDIISFEIIRPNLIGL